MSEVVEYPAPVPCAVLAGSEAHAAGKTGLRSLAACAGPAIMASVAYVDPGNFATNIQAGAKYNFNLLGVVILANVVAMLFQGLSAKLGIATGQSLAELCRQEFPRPVVWGMWLVSEVAAMATDLAEFVGCAIGLSLLSGISLLSGMVVTAAVIFGILSLQKSGSRPLELFIGGLVALIGACYVAELVIAPPDWGAVGLHVLAPTIADTDALTIAVGIVGATIMPHAIYLHSGLTRGRISLPGQQARRWLIRFSNREVILAMGFAGLINLAMVVMSAQAFHDGIHDDVSGIETAYRTLIPLLGAGAAGIFLLSLIASGLSSSVVGTLAGQMIMQGFVGFRIPLWFRRVVTIAPALAIIAAGVDATDALIVSQVILSLTLPVPLAALILLTRRKDLLGEFANGKAVTTAASAAAVLIALLNGALVLQVSGSPF